MTFTRLSSLSLHTWRRISQVFFLIALNPVFFSAKEACVPVLNCWACPYAAFGCPIGAIGHALALGLVPIVALGTVIIFGAVIGRMVCGWACPFGFFQELVHKIPSKKFNLPKWAGGFKYAILIVLVVLVPLVFHSTGEADGKLSGEDFYFCNLCPAAFRCSSVHTRLLRFLGLLDLISPPTASSSLSSLASSDSTLSCSSACFMSSSLDAGSYRVGSVGRDP